ncbi:hypothetical protein [Polynucleobacter antarcticus]|uniref:hypothetical protein n=1 Tax=Polynucleobacter antarcticus TaxID=1743162 RepID=UPI0039F10DBA
MFNVEVLIGTLFRSHKLQHEEQHLSNQKEFKKLLSDPELAYERKDKDWWWCDDV